MRVPEEFGSYLVGEQLGIGGMAVVHLAEARSAAGFRKRVALKRLLPHVAHNPELVAAFAAEARLAGYLRHPNIAQIFDFGKLEGVHYIAFEFVPGPTLEQLARQCNANVGPIPTPIVLNIAHQICDALDHAHNLTDEAGRPLGIVHRDVSPPNLIVSNNGLVKLIDFGLAKAKRASNDTQVGVIKGKLSYVAPEYLAGKLDARCDLWAVGVVVHELLTGHKLFDAANDFEALDRVRSMRVRPPSKSNPDVPDDLDDIVMTALQRDPASRWQSAAAMRTALGGVAAQLQAITNSQLIDWVEWAFMQDRKPQDSVVAKLIEILDQPSRPIEAVADDDPKASRPAIVAAMLERRKQTTPAVGAEVVRPVLRQRSRVGLVLLLLVLVLAAGAAGAIATYGVPRW